MALMERCNSTELKQVENAEERLGFGCVMYARGLGRKRIVISSNHLDSFPTDLPLETPLKRQCSGRIVLESEKSVLELLPQDLLIKVLCGVEHKDLRQLSEVSKTIREATMIAKQWHFAYSTPTKIRAFRTSIEFDNQGDLKDIETPNAPLRNLKKRISRKKIADVTTVLFRSPEEDQWRSRRGLFAESDT